MVNRFFILFLITILPSTGKSQTVGKVGINTNNPQAMFHVKDSSVLFSGAPTLPNTPGNPPISGAGVRMMWYADKGAFRAGLAASDFWGKDSTGIYSFSAGGLTRASGIASSATGYLTNASADYSFAGGLNTVASGMGSVALGELTESTGITAFAMGWNTKGIGPNAAVFGEGSVAFGTNAFATGYNTTAIGSISAAFGNSTISRSYACLTLGQFNDSIATSSRGNWLSRDPVFIIGNGTAHNARSNALTILKNGKTGINTSDPSAMLHVKDSSVVFTASEFLPANPGPPPVSGAGSRMMWYPDKAAFRVGTTINGNWNKDSIGDFSFGSGYATKAKGTFSTAMGFGTDAIGSKSTAMGSVTNAIGEYSTAMGYSTEAVGEKSTAMGNNTYAIGENATATGEETRASGINSTALGYRTTSLAYGSLSVGQYNDSIISSSGTSWVTTDPVFIIGNGAADNARSNAFSVLKNANTGINVSTPSAALHIKGTAASFDAHLRLETTGTGTDYVNMLYDGNTKFRNSAVGDEYQFRNSANAITHRLFDNGNMTIAGTLTQNSDARLKKNITQLDNSLQRLLRINGYQYYWIDSSHDKSIQTGVLAQEIEKEMPELVRADEAGVKSVNYNGLIPYLIEAIKELKQENEILKQKIDKLTK